MTDFYQRRRIILLLLTMSYTIFTGTGQCQLITPADTKGGVIIGDSLSDGNSFREPCTFNAPTATPVADRNRNDYTWVDVLAARREMPIGNLVAVNGRSYQRREFNLVRNCATPAKSIRRT